MLLTRADVRNAVLLVGNGLASGALPAECLDMEFIGPAEPEKVTAETRAHPCGWARLALDSAGFRRVAKWRLTVHDMMAADPLLARLWYSEHTRATPEQVREAIWQYAQESSTPWGVDAVYYEGK